MTDQTESASELERWGIRWDSPTKPVCEAMADGYWTPWHVATAKMREADTSLARMAEWWEKTIAERDQFRADRDRLAGEVEEVKAEHAAMLADWNAMVVASGSKTHGGAVGHIAVMVRENTRLTSELENAREEIASMRSNAQGIRAAIREAEHGDAARSAGGEG